MFIAAVVVSCVLAIAMVGSGIAKLTGNAGQAERMEQVGFPRRSDVDTRRPHRGRRPQTPRRAVLVAAWRHCSGGRPRVFRRSARLLKSGRADQSMIGAVVLTRWLSPPSRCAPRPPDRLGGADPRQPMRSLSSFAMRVTVSAAS